MNDYRIFALAAVIIVILASTSLAQDPSGLPYMNPKLSPEERAADLVHRMTLEEKASQLVNQARADRQPFHISLDAPPAGAKA